jgi:lipopolysaccharide transport system permease protein
MPIVRNGSLIRQLVEREIVGRYKGSVLGILWSLLTPLFLLAVYTFVFGAVFKARWQSPGGGDADASIADFAVILFAGLIVFQLLAEVVNRSPTLVLSNANYVKKVVFPLELLPVVAVGSALFHAAVSIAVLVVFNVVLSGHIPATTLLLPLVLAPYVAFILGLAWFFAALGVFVRDIGQVLGPLVTALMFLSPIFYSSSALPDWVAPWLTLNPVTLPVEQTRDVLIFGRLPDFGALARYSLVAIAVCWLGYTWFEKTKRGFADVL